MAIKQYPEFSEKYPAIDGIAKCQRPSEEEARKRLEQKPCDPVYVGPPQRAIRSDIEEILGMDNVSFDSWYGGREKAILDLLEPLRIAATVPDLRYASEEQKLGLEASSVFRGFRERLEDGLEYLQVIKKVRDEQR